MFELRCTVRKCQATLHPVERRLVCDAGHAFDRAKEGYWNLLQPQDRRSRNPGDPDEAVLARHRWLARGFAQGLVETLQDSMARSSADRDPPPRTLDLGCGEGSFGPALFAAEAEGYCGIDLSKRAIKFAARRWPQATWVLANADRELPAWDASVDRVISLFGRRPAAEIKRVLAPQGVCIVAVPGEDDLIELREQVQQSGLRRSRFEMVIDELQLAGLVCQTHRVWRHSVSLDREAILDAMAMTYRAQRHSQQTRLESVTSMTVTLAADLLLFHHA